uniref:Uncharacterized protein n=1 Tax=Anopheles farauti TaxID=69004 RepID=A0A182QDF8_9DIPT
MNGPQHKQQGDGDDHTLMVTMIVPVLNSFVIHPTGDIRPKRNGRSGGWVYTRRPATVGNMTPGWLHRIQHNVDRAGIYVGEHHEYMTVRWSTFRGIRRQHWFDGWATHSGGYDERQHGAYRFHYEN